MDGIIASIAGLFSSVKAIDWAAFFIFWLSLERVLKAIATITPWKWDDDLVAAASRAIKSLKKDE